MCTTWHRFDLNICRNEFFNAASIRENVSRKRLWLRFGAKYTEALAQAGPSPEHDSHLVQFVTALVQARLDYLLNPQDTHAAIVIHRVAPNRKTAHGSGVPPPRRSTPLTRQLQNAAPFACPHLYGIYSTSNPGHVPPKTYIHRVRS